ncbi:titin homolog isoform X3 [Ochlerotatus camptorhynchus]
MLSRDQKCLAPVFHSIPQDQVIKEGGSVSFKCTVHSQLSCWSVWDKNGIISIPSHRIVLTESSNTKCLKITNVSSADSGFYRITVENDHGRVEASIQLKVAVGSQGCSISTNADNAPIRVKRQLMKHSTGSDMIVLAGQYRSSSVTSLKVYSNGKMLDEDEITHVIVHNHYVIIIQEYNTFGMTNYCCILQSMSGKTTGMVAQVSTNKDSNMLPPIIVEHLPPLVTSFEGYETDLLVRVECNTAFTYVWLRNDVVIEDCHEFRYTDHGQGVLSLRIIDPFLLDSGVYKCIITSVGGSCKSQCCVKFEESICESKSLPQIMLYPQSYVAELGSAVIICAHVTPPNCNIEWKICGSIIEKNNKNFQMKTNADGLHFFFINNVNYNHCGEIQCMVTIQNHTMTTTAFTMLTVMPCISNKRLLPDSTVVQEPYFLNIMKNFRVFTGTKLRLEVLFNGYPEPQVIWMRAGRPIEDTNASITTKPGHSILTIDGINANQSGKYAAFIINNYGSDIMSASVSVEGPPDPPSGKPSITLDSQGMIVTWCGPPYDGGCVISGFL